MITVVLSKIRLKQLKSVSNIIRRCQSTVHVVTPPQLPENVYLEDPILARLVHSLYNQRRRSYTHVNDDLICFGSRYRELYELAQKCEQYQPRLQRLDGWGGRVDKVLTCDAWKQLHDIASAEGIVSIGHETEADLKELHQCVKLLLFGGVSGMVSCPLAMTDGAATTLTKLLKQHQHCKPGDCTICSEEWRTTLQNAVQRLTTRDPRSFWTAGQWMTERHGGSDVTNATQTYAEQDNEGVIRLYGNKFYTSAIDCNVTLTLARYKDNISLFLLHLPQEYDGTIQLERLKDKLGTRQLPTAELTLNGVPATLLAAKGIASIIPVLQVTRLYNSIMAASYLRHVTSLAKSYAKTRAAFGSVLSELPLHRAALAKLETFARAITLQSVDLALVLHSKDDTPSLSTNVVRVLSAVVKAHTAIVAVNTIREALECFGGAGYMEDTGLPGIFRDACVLPVWEGTTDVLSAETMRALSRDGSRDDVMKYIRALAQGSCGLGGYQHTNTSTSHPLIDASVERLDSYLSQLNKLIDEAPDHMGRTVTLGLGSVHAAAVLINLARYTCNPSDLAAASLWSRIGLLPLHSVDTADISNVLSGG